MIADHYSSARLRIENKVPEQKLALTCLIARVRTQGPPRKPYSGPEKFGAPSVQNSVQCSGQQSHIPYSI